MYSDTELNYPRICICSMLIITPILILFSLFIEYAYGEYNPLIDKYALLTILCLIYPSFSTYILSLSSYYFHLVKLFSGFRYEIVLPYYVLILHNIATSLSGFCVYLVYYENSLKDILVWLSHILLSIPITLLLYLIVLILHKDVIGRFD